MLLALAALAGCWLVYLLFVLLDDALLATALAALLIVPLAAWLGHRLIRPIAALVRTLSGAVASYRDGDFATSVHRDRDDELGDLVEAYNELGGVLRDERQQLFQRELLLDTVVQNTPTALLLEDAAGHVVYANLAARKLFGTRSKLEGHRFDELVARAPEAMRASMQEGQDGIFTARIEDQEESFHLSRRSFSLHGRHHTLHLIRRITRELSRQEVAVWKKVIRVISHELNNSLAPISSLAHSGHELVQRGQPERLEKVFATIEERAAHLDRFVRGYATFAKLPAPRPERFAWQRFLEALATQQPFTWSAPEQSVAWADPAQLGQALVNLAKNAVEAGAPADSVEVEVKEVAGQWRIEVRDRGSGMSEPVMASALLPFYSTKRSGTGLGLALTREIAEAHGGRIVLSNRDGGGLCVTLWIPQQQNERGG
ncbi:MAG: HAMP domain-containing protein [Xanthomonadales bacterium]|nr:HAMP domain-containing protein [Xanthomonadales bacterium]